MSFTIILFDRISKNPSLIIYTDLKITTLDKKVSSKEREREEIKRQYCAKYIIEEEKEKYHSTFYLKTKIRKSKVGVRFIEPAKKITKQPGSDKSDPYIKTMQKDFEF